MLTISLFYKFTFRDHPNHIVSIDFKLILMSYILNFFDEKAIASFSEDVKEGELTLAFLEIVDTINIKEIKHIIFDCSLAIDYTFPKDYMTRVKVVTQFSTAWNSNINIIFVATNEQVRYMAKGFINHSEDLKWKYHLFEKMSEANEFCDKSA